MGSFKFRFYISFPNQILAAGVFAQMRLRRSCAYVYILAQKGFSELWLLSALLSGSLTSYVAGGQVPQPTCVLGSSSVKYT